jgi:hypothetical protein
MQSIEFVCVFPQKQNGLGEATMLICAGGSKTPIGHLLILVCEIAADQTEFFESFGRAIQEAGKRASNTRRRYCDERSKTRDLNPCVHSFVCGDDLFAFHSMRRVEIQSCRDVPRGSIACLPHHACSSPNRWLSR